MRNPIGAAIDAVVGPPDALSGEKGAIMGATVQHAAELILTFAVAAAAGWGLLRLARTVIEVDQFDLEGAIPSAKAIQINPQ